jgi:hypothetical protein
MLSPNQDRTVQAATPPEYEGDAELHYPEGVQELSRDNDLAARRWVEAERAYNAALKAPLSYKGRWPP